MIIFQKAFECCVYVVLKNLITCTHLKPQSGLGINNYLIYHGCLNVLIKDELHNILKGILPSALIFRSPESLW